MQLTRHTISTVITSLCWCSGCDSFYGVSRTLPLNTLPSPTAVEESIKSTPGVLRVTHQYISPQESWSLYTGKMRDSGFTQFTCQDAAHAFAAVEPKETREAGKRLYVYCLWMNHTPTQSELSNARGLINRICNSLHKRVPMVPASSSNEDEFVGIEKH